MSSDAGIPYDEEFNPTSPATFVAIRDGLYADFNGRLTGAVPWIVLTERNSRIFYIAEAPVPYWVLVVFRTGYRSANRAYVVRRDQTGEYRIISSVWLGLGAALGPVEPPVYPFNPDSPEIFRSIREHAAMDLNNDFLDEESPWVELHAGNALIFYIAEAKEPYWLLVVFGTTDEADGVGIVRYQADAQEFVLVEGVGLSSEDGSVDDDVPADEDTYDVYDDIDGVVPTDEPIVEEPSVQVGYPAIRGPMHYEERFVARALRWYRNWREARRLR